MVYWKIIQFCYSGNCNKKRQKTLFFYQSILHFIKAERKWRKKNLKWNQTWSENQSLTTFEVLTFLTIWWTIRSVMLGAQVSFSTSLIAKRNRIYDGFSVTQQMVGIFIQFNAPFYWTDSYLLGTNDCIQSTKHECLILGVGIFTILSVNNELINFTNFIGQRVYLTNHFIKR